MMRLLLLGILCSLGREAGAREPWQTLTNCHYLPNPANDGDSFHVRAAGKEYIFRLYFVDTPETDASIPDRVADQARYFHTTVPETLRIGIEAERFTKQRLARPFTVRSCRQDARGRSRLPRYFAFVQIDSADLGETLVANGLARLYGAASEAPEMSRPEVEWRKLEELERKAKAQKIGGWGVGGGRLNQRAATQPATGADYFQAFFHPNSRRRPANPESSTAIPRTRLDVNTASSEALQGIPGIGRVLAARIIAVRPFQSADDLQKVKGIKAKRYEQLRPYFQ